MIISPLAGVLPGPGGIFIFAGGLALTLKYSEWADWGMRRPSAKRREAIRKQREATGCLQDD